MLLFSLGEELRAVLQAVLASESLWTGPQVAAWIAAKGPLPLYPGAATIIRHVSQRDIWGGFIHDYYPDVA
jgi:hypothetical protein